MLTFILLTAIFTPQKGYIPLHFASVRGDAEMVKALVEAVSKVDVKDKVSISQYIFVTFCLHYYLKNFLRH